MDPFQGIDEFIKEITNQVESLGINTQDFVLDHVGYRTETLGRYYEVKDLFLSKSTEIGEVEIKGRPISIWKFNQPLDINETTQVEYFELMAPTENNTFPEGLQHVDFVIPFKLRRLLDMYPKIEWNMNAYNRKISPDLIIVLPEKKSVKFIEMGIEAAYHAQQKAGEL